jgi:hypothetical protein
MRSSMTLVVVLTLLLPPAAHSIDVSGDQWGSWTKENSPYNVVGEVHVPGESTLVIEPGVLVNFQGHYKLVVDSLATLRAIGTASDSIHFTAQDTATGWHGIRFLNANEDSQVSFCQLEYGRAVGSGGAIYCYNSSPTISNNRISKNSAGQSGGGIYCYNNNGLIENNIISDNLSLSQLGYGGGICSDGLVLRLDPTRYFTTRHMVEPGCFAIQTPSLRQMS